MIKYPIVLALIFAIILPTHAQQSEAYRVVRVVGHVESTKLNRVLKTEDIIPEGDKLKFKGKQDYLIIFHPKTGRKRIQGVPDEQPRELNTLLQSFLKPDQRSTGTRSINGSYVEDLKLSLKDNVLLVGPCTIELDPKKFPVKAPATIKAQYRVGNSNELTTIPVLTGQTINLDRKTLFPSASFTSTPKVLLLYFTKDSNSSIEAEDFLGNFVPVYADDASLIAEVRSIVESMKGSPSETIHEEIVKYLTAEYGRPQPINFDAWLKTNKLLTMP